MDTEALPDDHETRASLDYRLAGWPRRRRDALRFQRWRYEHGRITLDDKAEPLTDDEIDYLARHVLP